MLDSENWIRVNHPNAANDLLFTSGLYIDKTGRLKVEKDDLINLRKALERKNKRGDTRHAILFKVTILAKV